MNAQTAIDVLGKVLPLVLDVASLIPGVNIPVGAVKVAEDVISIEQAAHTWLTTTPEGKAVWAKIAGLSEKFGGNVSITPDGYLHFSVAQAIDVLERSDA